MTWHRIVRSLVLVALLWAGLPVTGPAQADERCFPETQQCLTGRVREFWEQNGGLPIFGYPIGPLREETIEGRIVQAQWFERNRLELHPENQRPYDVLLGRLGVDRLVQQGRDWSDFPKGTPTPDCRFFAETGHSVCGAILAAWRAGGLEFDGDPAAKSEAENLALFGLPLGEVMTEAIEGKPYQVQWFERARFELHPEHAPPHDVLLGLLGREMLAPPPAPPPPPVPGGPSPATPVPGSEYDGAWFGHNTSDDLPFEFLINAGRLVTVRGSFRFPGPNRPACRYSFFLDFRRLGDQPKVDSSGFRFVHRGQRVMMDGSGRFDGPGKASGIVSYEISNSGICNGKAGFYWSTQRRVVTLLPVDGTWEGSAAGGERITFTIKNRTVTTFAIELGRDEVCKVRVDLNQLVDGNNILIDAKGDRWTAYFLGQFSSATEVRGLATFDSERGDCTKRGVRVNWGATRRGG